MTDTIELDALTFLDFATSGWVFSDLVDWFGQTDDKKSLQERPQGHGAFSSSQSLRSSRAISFKANYLADSAAELEAAVDTLAAVGAEAPVLMRYTTDAGSSWRVVSVQTSSVKDSKGMDTGEVDVDVIARDPRRYADSTWVRTTPPSPGAGLVFPVIFPATWPAGGASGRVTLQNIGKAPSSPVFRLAGGFDTALITETSTGERVGFERVVGDGSMVEISYDTKRAMLDGYADMSRWLKFREWGAIPAGSSRTYQFDVTGAAVAPYMDGKVNPAWW